MHRKSLIALLIVAVFSAPAASATWYFAQTYEPSTEYDTSEWIWADPPPTNESRVYFAVESHYLAAAGPYLNPNVGALHTRIEVSNGEHHSAVLGVWRDCNGDGYIGMVETAVREYSSELLLDKSVCAPVSGPPNAWTRGAHNYNGWVTELIPITRNAPAAVDRRIYDDAEAAVWGDYHRPDEDPYFRPCPLSPQPRGTYQSTGGVVNYVDCRVDIIGMMNLGIDAVGNPAGLRFTDGDDARSGPLGQVATFGPEDSSERSATVWDCGSQTRVGDELNETDAGPLAPAAVGNIRVAAVDPEVHDTSDPVRGVAATYNHTNEGAMAAGGSRDCDTTNDFGHDFYSTTCPTFIYCVGESDFNGINPKDKREAHWNMASSVVGRGNSALANTFPGGTFGTAGIATDGGIRWPGAHWSVGSYWATKPGFQTVRTNLQDPQNSNVEIAPALWTTWYARVGSNTTNGGFALPGNGAAGVYASWHCGEETTGVHHGFNCNKDLWYLNADGTPSCPTCGTELTRPELARPGDLFHLRDVDCYDGGIGDSGLGIQPSYYGTDPCV